MFLKCGPVAIISKTPEKQALLAWSTGERRHGWVQSPVMCGKKQMWEMQTKTPHRPGVLSPMIAM